MSHDWDDDHRPRRRSRRGRKRGSGAGVWLALTGIALLLLLGGVVAVVVARKGGRGGAGGTPGTDDVARGFAVPGAREITAEEFKAIKKEDTLASLESRFGPAERLGAAELERVYFSVGTRGRPGRVKVSFATQLREIYKIPNPEAYHWRGGKTEVYVVPAQGNPTANLYLKRYHSDGTNERGEYQGETALEVFVTEPLPPLQPPTPLQPPK